MMSLDRSKIKVEDDGEISRSNLTFIQRCRKLISYKKKYSTIIVGIIIIIIIIFTIIFKKNTFTGLKKYPEENVICFNKSDFFSYNQYISQLNNLIKPYKELIVEDEEYIWCHKSSQISDKLCTINPIQPCNELDDWGYSNNTPCVILTYENNSKYKPIFYDSINQLPYNISLQLKEINDDDDDDDETDEKLMQLYFFCTYSNLINFYYYFFPIYNVNEYLPPIALIPFNLNFYDGGDYNDVDNVEYNVECSLWNKYSASYSVEKISFKIKHGNC